MRKGKTVPIEDFKKSQRYALEANNMFALIKAGHCANPIIECEYVGTPFFNKEKKEKNE